MCDHSGAFYELEMETVRCSPQTAPQRNKDVSFFISSPKNVPYSILTCVKQILIHL